jgi:SAM-dependent methyltransferase
MDVRSSTNPVLVGVREWLEVLNRRHPWNHNDHFHGWILRKLPQHRHAALDVGCGRGLLVERLVDHFALVHGIDVDEGMAASAAARVARHPRATIRRGSFEDVERVGAGFDLVTMVAVLHHLDLDRTLARAGDLLAPGGRLLVVGIARVNSASDVAIDCLSAAANPIMGLIKHPRRARGIDQVDDDALMMPVRDPTTTWTEIAAAAQSRLPGARTRRRLYFRYTILWDKPQ